MAGKSQTLVAAYYSRTRAAWIACMLVVDDFGQPLGRIELRDTFQSYEHASAATLLLTTPAPDDLEPWPPPDRVALPLELADEEFALHEAECRRVFNGPPKPTLLHAHEVVIAVRTVPGCLQMGDDPALTVVREAAWYTDDDRAEALELEDIRQMRLGWRYGMTLREQGVEFHRLMRKVREERHGRGSPGR